MLARLLWPLMLARLLRDSDALQAQRLRGGGTVAAVNAASGVVKKSGTLKPSPERRQNVMIPDKLIVKAFELLPHKVSQLCPIKRIHVMLPYPNRNFKVAPRWGHAAKFAPVVDSILTSSGGYNITHACAVSGITKYVSDNNLENKYDGDAIDRAGYTVRAVVAQMFNHRDKELSYENDKKKNINLAQSFL
jgi:hypothetical protein